MTTCSGKTIHHKPLALCRGCDRLRLFVGELDPKAEHDGEAWRCPNRIDPAPAVHRVLAMPMVGEGYEVLTRSGG